MKLGINEIKNLIPHRDPFLFIDECEILEKGKKGITKDELSAKKTTISGSFKVSMDSTSGLTGKILSNAEQGRPIDYLDKYPEIINSLTLENVNAAIKTYIDPKNLFTISAGTDE